MELTGEQAEEKHYNTGTTRGKVKTVLELASERHLDFIYFYRPRSGLGKGSCAFAEKLLLN